MSLKRARIDENDVKEEKESGQIITDEASELDQKASESDPIKDNQNIGNQLNSLTDLNLNLGSSLRNEIISHIKKFSDLLNSVSIKLDDKQELFKMNNYIMHKLSILSYNDDGSKLRKKLELIDESLTDDLEKNEDDLFYELSWLNRNDIINLLVKNSNALILFEDTVSSELKKDLFTDNNNIISLLVSLESKPFCHSMANNDEEGNLIFFPAIFKSKLTFNWCLNRFSRNKCIKRIKNL